MERHCGRFFVRHPSEFAEEMKRFVAGQFFDETVELRTVASDLVDLRKRILIGTHTRIRDIFFGAGEERELGNAQ